MAPAVSDYVLGHSERELERLGAQARVLEPFTRHFLREAGLRPGMRVLDVGSGAGDVAFVAVDLVHPDGMVLGIDRSREAVSRARSRAQGRRLHNVNFVAADLATLDLGQTFDAIVGRLVLMYSPDPAAVLKRLKDHLAPGGIMAFQEYDIACTRTYPELPLAGRCIELLCRALEAGGADTRMGSKLHAAFLAAGLPAPALRLDASISGGGGSVGTAMLAEVLNSLRPALSALDPQDTLGIATLKPRLSAEMAASEGIVVAPQLIGAAVAGIA